MLYGDSVEQHVVVHQEARQIHGANLARNLQAGLAFPSNADMNRAIQLNLIKDCPVTVKDMGMAIKVWGPNIEMLKGKPFRKTPPVFRQDIIEIPKEIQGLHKDVTLTIDILFVNKIPFIITYSLVICFLSVTHLSNRKALTIFNALKRQTLTLTLFIATTKGLGVGDFY